MPARDDPKPARSERRCGTVRLARVFRSGNSQAVRLPRDMQIDADEVEIFRDGDDIVLRRRPRNLAAAFDLLASLPDDFMAEGRHDASPQPREAL